MWSYYYCVFLCFNALEKKKHLQPSRRRGAGGGCTWQASRRSTEGCSWVVALWRCVSPHVELVWCGVMWWYLSSNHKAHVCVWCNALALLKKTKNQENCWLVNWEKWGIFDRMLRWILNVSANEDLIWNKFHRNLVRFVELWFICTKRKLNKFDINIIMKKEGNYLFMSYC